MSKIKIGFGVFFTALVIFFGWAFVDAFETNCLVFVGEETFTTFEEAQSFQIQVVEEAERLGASVQSFDLSILSPPSITYSILMPDGSEFKYGTRSMSFREARGYEVGVVLLFGVIWVFYWMYPEPRKEENRNENLET